MRHDRGIRRDRRRQTAILTTIVMISKGAPTRGAVVAGNATLELYLTLAATAAVTAVMGLAMSAAAKSQDQTAHAGDLGDAVDRVLRRDDSGDRPTWSRPIVVGGPGPLGFRHLRVHHRPAHHRPLLQTKDTLW